MGEGSGQLVELLMGTEFGCKNEKKITFALS